MSNKETTSIQQVKQSMQVKQYILQSEGDKGAIMSIYITLKSSI